MCVLLRALTICRKEDFLTIFGISIALEGKQRIKFEGTKEQKDSKEIVPIHLK